MICRKYDISIVKSNKIYILINRGATGSSTRSKYSYITIKLLTEYNYFQPKLIRFYFLF